MNDQEFTQILASDPDTLPYFITEVQTKVAVPVMFQKTTEVDIAELYSPRWKNAVYTDVWLSYVREERTLKLVTEGEAGHQIHGIVRLGEVLPGGKFLRNSLLETMPQNNYGAENRIYSGVGRVLVARLVVESILAQQQGGVIVSLGTSTPKHFYLALGFRKQSGSERRFALFANELRQLVQSVLRPSQLV